MSTMDYMIMRLFMIDITNLIRVKVQLCKEFHISPNEIDKMVFWEYEMFMEELSHEIEEQNKREKEESDRIRQDRGGAGNNPYGSYKMPKMPAMLKMPPMPKMM